MNHHQGSWMLSAAKASGPTGAGGVTSCCTGPVKAGVTGAAPWLKNGTGAELPLGGVKKVETAAGATGGAGGGSATNVLAVTFLW